jgi:hypothetical protein
LKSTIFGMGGVCFSLQLVSKQNTANSKTSCHAFCRYMLVVFRTTGFTLIEDPFYNLFSETEKIHSGIYLIVINSA